MVRSSLRAMTLAVAVAALAACNNDMVTAPGPVGSYSLAGVPLPNRSLPAYRELQPGTVKICVFDHPADVTTTSNPGVPAANIEPATTLSMGTPPFVYECSITWIAPAGSAANSFTVTTNVVGPPDYFLRRVFLSHTDQTRNFNASNVPGLPDGDCQDEDIVDPLVAIGGLGGPTAGAVVWYKLCPGTPPPPPEGECNGLTPGFWKNYKNHYTETEFALILDGTGSPLLTNAQAKDVLSSNNPALVRLAKFKLANELTISLVLNPTLDQKGFLTADCAINGTTLLAALALAQQMLDNPGDYTEAQILALGTLLDKFANL